MVAVLCVSIPYWFDCNVNESGLFEAQILGSQFHIGSIVMARVCRKCKHRVSNKSQFHIGSIVMGNPIWQEKGCLYLVSIPYWFDCNVIAYLQKIGLNLYPSQFPIGSIVIFTFVLILS